MHKTSNLKFLMWALSVLTYVLAAVNRSSFSALGIVAQEHFSAEAALISTFVVVQLAVYAAAQIPVGFLLDRLGASVMLCAGLFQYQPDQRFDRAKRHAHCGDTPGGISSFAGLDGRV